MFELHHRLKEDCIELGSFRLCTLLLMNAVQYRWFILVPRREGVSEIYQLSDEDQQQLIRESSYLSARLAELFKADKINVASLGNVVPQLHIHHILRFKDDPAWPAPVWGHAPSTPYSDDEIKAMREILSPVLEKSF